MILLELAAQGIRGAVSASGRATFRPGYVVVPAGGDAFCATVGALLWCDAAEGEALRTAAGQPVRAGATFTTQNRTLYRLVTDFASEFQLQRYDASARTFSPAAAGRDAVQAWMREQTGLPSHEAFEDLLSISAARLPSRLAAHKRTVAPPPAPAAADPGRIRARLDELREQLERSREVDRLQQRVEQLQARSGELEQALQEGSSLRSELDRASARLRALGPAVDAADALQDAEARLAAHGRATARREEALARIAEEREALAADAVPPRPLGRSPELWLGLGAGAAAFSVGIAAEGAMRYVALLDVPAFGWAAWAALRWVGRAEGRERAANRSRVVDERERKVEEQWQAEAGPVQRAMATAGVADVLELRRALESVAEARAAERAAAEALSAWEARPEIGEIERERQRVNAELKDADAALGDAASGYVRDVGTLEAEIARLEGELAARDRPPGAAPRGPGGSDDPLAELVRRASGGLGAGAEALAAVETRTSEVLAVIAGRRIEGLWADPDGKVVVQPAGGRVRFRDLPPEARDLCWTALKLAFLEHALGRGQRFAVVDSALDSLPLVTRRVAAHILKRAARGGQILHATADAVFREAADHAA